MKKEEFYLDTSECSEEEQRRLFSLLSPERITAQIWYMIHNRDWKVLDIFKYLFFNEHEVWEIRPVIPSNKTEITYSKFVAMLEQKAEINPISLDISKEEFISNCDHYRQNLNGRESEEEIFLAGIEAAIGELSLKFKA